MKPHLLRSMDTFFFSYIALIILATMLSGGICSLRIQCNERDRNLLLNFKHTVLDPSDILSSWSDEQDCCEWEGVHCGDNTGRVVELSPRCSIEAEAVDCGEKKSHCLTGQLPLSMLLHLEFLDHLDLSSHDFLAVIQNDSMLERKNSSNLHSLDLSHNEDLHFDSLHWLSRVPSLEHLDLRGINLRGRVDWFQLPTLVPFLEELYFSGCQLSDIGPFLTYANFTSLQVLGLSGNAFTTEFIPDWLFNLSDLTYIGLAYNHFQGPLPERLLNLKKIQILSLSSNEFTGSIPDWFGQLEHLQVLYVGNNSLSGPIPSTLGNLSSLNVLEVGHNYLSGSLPESLGQLLNLEWLDLSDNHFTAFVSERHFFKLSYLRQLSMGSPGLIFDFDPLWVPPFQLEMINLDHMVGSKLPAWLYTQTSVGRLSITDSVISFEPQDKFWDFVAQVPYIAVYDNTIHGDMSNLLLNSTFINLSSNKIKGGQLPRLSPNVMSFSVANNSLQGSISSFLCENINGRSQLLCLDMSNNVLSGGLTNCWMHWKSLVIVKLDGNNLTGTIPPSIGLLSNLTILHLNKNNLFGEIPLSLRNCQKLQILDVGENKLSGFLPNWMPQNANILRLRSNQLSGNIPPQICQLASLMILDFADNKISGSLPTCLQNLAAMTFPNASNNEVYRFCIRTTVFTYEFGEHVMVHTKGQGLMYDENLKFLHAVDLSSNNISGPIPPEIFRLTGLQSLNLSHNQLEGNMPNEIGNLNNLESLDLSSNQLWGEIPQSIAKLSYLGTLNLSFNNLTGKIPAGTQLQGFDALSYIGNPELCGAPLPKNCTNNKNSKPSEEGNDNEEEDESISSFYIAMGVGFATAFWGVCGAIFFNRNFRHSYFRFLYHIRDTLYVMVVLNMNRFR